MYIIPFWSGLVRFGIIYRTYIIPPHTKEKSGLFIRSFLSKQDIKQIPHRISTTAVLMSQNIMITYHEPCKEHCGDDIKQSGKNFRLHIYFPFFVRVLCCLFLVILYYHNIPHLSSIIFKFSELSSVESSECRFVYYTVLNFPLVALYIIPKV